MRESRASALDSLSCRIMPRMRKRKSCRGLSYPWRCACTTSRLRRSTSSSSPAGSPRRCCRKLSARISIPSAALFLVAAAVASDIFPSLAGLDRDGRAGRDRRADRDPLRRRLVDRLAALPRRGVPIASLGVLGTFATAGAGRASFAHWAFGLGWITSGLLGAAVAPTDPAVMFSVLGDREIGGRTGTILEGESGANDPVGIALMLGMIELATHADASVLDRRARVLRADGDRARDRRRRRAGRGAGAAPASRCRTPASTRCGRSRCAGLVYGVATVAHGSGFLAVFVAGLLVGDVDAPFKAEIEVFQDGLASLAEIVVFVALGLTIDLGGLGGRPLGRGPRCSRPFVALVARPLVVGAAARARPAAPRRAAVRHLGRAEGRRADPARGVRARARTSPTRSASTRSSSSSCSRRWSSRAGRSRSPRGGSASRCGARTRAARSGRSPRRSSGRACRPCSMRTRRGGGAIRGSRSFSYSASLACTCTSAPTRSSSAHGPIGQPAP